MLQTGHVMLQPRMGDFGVNLRRADVGVAEQLADNFDRYPLREGDGRGESVPGEVENLLKSK